MKQALDLSPDEAVRAAAQLEASGRIDDAEGLLRAVLKIDPKHFHALNRLGGILAVQRKSYYEALYRFDRALRIDPKSAMARSNLGMVLSELGHNEEAAGQFQRAADVNPENPVYWSNLGNTLERLQLYDQALEALSRALELSPESATTHFNIGIVLLRLNRRHEGIACFDEAIRLDPDYPAEVYYNRALAKLALGDYAQGLKDYEYRLKTPDQVDYIGPFEQPKWTGVEPIDGKTILVHGEQGLGDNIQFMRYVPMLLERGAKVVMVLHRALKPLVNALLPSVNVLDPGEDYPPFDYYVPIMSLALCFGTTLETIQPPWRIGYTPLRSYNDRLRVGLCWSGNFQHKNDAHRSIPLSQFSPLFDVPGVQFISLQQDVRDTDEAEMVNVGIDQSFPLADLCTTATTISLLDLVITVDTAVAHLAASIGVRTWILLPAHATDWRWGIDGMHTPWYPTACLFRQSHVGDWESVIKEVGLYLDQMRRRPALTKAVAG